MAVAEKEQRNKKLVSLRLPPELIERLDAALAKKYEPLPAPARNKVIEGWILEKVQQMERL